MAKENEADNLQEEPSAKSSLVKVILYFRHGHRTPYLNVEKDFNIPTPSWPEGTGALTNLGKINAYLLGKRLRKRYDTVLTPYYSKSRVNVKSTGSDRTIMTASLVLAGMYPPKGHQIWNEDLLWSPIPIAVDDNPLKPYQCHRGLYEYLKYKPDEMTTAFRTFVSCVQEKSGYSFKHPECPDFDVFKIFDSFICLKGLGVSIPDWAETFAHENYSVIFDFFRRNTVYSEVQKQLGCNYLAENISNFISGSTNVMVNCVHDVNVLVLSSCLGFELESFPPPLSCIAVEIHEVNGVETVNVYYMADIESPFKQMEMACGLEPGIAAFEEMLSKYRVDDYDTLANSIPEELEFLRHEALLAMYNMGNSSN